MGRNPIGINFDDDMLQYINKHAHKRGERSRFVNKQLRVAINSEKLQHENTMLKSIVNKLIEGLNTADNTQTIPTTDDEDKLIDVVINESS